MRFFTSDIFHKTVLPSPKRHAQKLFQFFSNIWRVIRLFWWFAGVNAIVVDNGKASFAGVNDTGNACIAGVIYTSGAPSKLWEFAIVFKGTISKKTIVSVDITPQQHPPGKYLNKLNNSSNIREKKSKSFLGMSSGIRRSRLMKKTGGEKSRDTVPLSYQ